MLALPVYDPFCKQHITNHADPERQLIISQVIPAQQVKSKVVNPEGYGCHSHGITAHHPYLMRQHISFVDGGQPVQGSNKPPACHEHEQRSFPKTSFGKEGHVQTGGRTQEKDNCNIDLA